MLSGDPDEIGPAWDEALKSDRPVVIDAITDPNVPPLPHHIAFEQAKAFAASMWRGDPDRLGVIRQTLREASAALFRR